MATQTKAAALIRGGSPTIFVTDMDRAVQFYSETLELKIQYRAGNHFCMIDAGDGLTIGLHPPGEHAPEPGSNGATQLGLSVVRPIEEVVTLLRSRGVSFLGPVVDDEFVKLAFFTDPDGNALYLFAVVH